MTVFLSKPYLSKNNENTRLNANIKTDNDEFTLWYEVNGQYAQYLVTERCDPFVVLLIPWLMIKANKMNTNIILECESPVSAKLLHQLTNFYIPILCDNISYYSLIKINAIPDNTLLQTINAVGTGVSGGVDSSYTIAKHKDNSIQEYKLTHLLYNNVGIYGGYDSEAEKKLSDKTLKIAQEANLEYIYLTSNVCITLYNAAHAPIVPAVFFSTVLALQKLFNVYYYSSAFTTEDFCIDDTDAAYYDLLNVHCLSTENTTFYSSGIELTRLQKVSFIADYSFAQNNLFVCLNTKNGNNCGLCAKCTRTMAELEVLDKLDNFNKIFDIKSFRNNKEYHWGFILLKSKTDSFCKEIKNIYLKKHKHFPIKVYFAAFSKWIKRGFTAKNKARRLVENEIR